MEEDAPLEVCASPGIYRCEGCDGREDEIIGTDIGPGDGICVQKQCTDIENWKRAARDTPAGYDPERGYRRVTGATIPGLVERQSEEQIEAFRTVDPPAEAVAGCVAGAVPIEEEDAEQRAREEAEARENLRRQQIERQRAAVEQARVAEEEALLQAIADGTAWQNLNTGMMYSSLDALALGMYIEERDNSVTEITIETPETRVHNFPSSETIVMSYYDAARLQDQHWVEEGEPDDRLPSGWMFTVFGRPYLLVRQPDPTGVASSMELLRIAQYGRPIGTTKKKSTKKTREKVYCGLGYPNRRRYTLEQMLLPYQGYPDAIRELAQQLVDAGMISQDFVRENGENARALLEEAVDWMEEYPDLGTEVSIRISPKFKNQSAMIITAPYRAGAKKTKTKTKSRRRKSKSKSRRRKTKTKSRRRKSKTKSRRRKSKTKSRRRKSKTRSKTKRNIEFEVYNVTRNDRVAVYKTRRGAEIRADRETNRNFDNYIVREILDGHAKHTKTKSKSKSRRRK